MIIKRAMHRPTAVTSGLVAKASPEIAELWGEGPLFPGPGWLLRWSLSVEEQQRWSVALKPEDVWGNLKATIPQLSSLADALLRVDPLPHASDRLPLQTVVAFAEALIQPARIEISRSFTVKQLGTAALAVRCDHHELAGRALTLAARLVLIGCQGTTPAQIDLASMGRSLADLITKARICCGHALTSAQLAEARRRSIPVFLVDPAQRIYQFGTGMFGRLISSSSNDHDSALGVDIAANKKRCRQLLRLLGMPVPREVSIPLDASDEQLRAAASQVGYPCVVKPQDGEQGQGVTANICAEADLRIAVQKARGCTSLPLLLQNHIDGDDYRLNIIAGEIAFVLRRTPPVIIGNGSSTVSALIDRENAKRRQLKRDGRIAGEIDPHDPEIKASIKRAGLHFEAVPSKGQTIRLRGNANVSTGGLREPLDPCLVHPVIRNQALAIAQTLRLEVCGLDYICPDISGSPDRSAGAWIEVNSMPQNEAGRASLLLDNLFPDGCAHSIATTTCIHDWQPADALTLRQLLAEFEAMHPEMCIGIPVELAPQIVPLLQGSHRQRVHVFAHPREMLLNHANSHVVFLVSPRLIQIRGLPASAPTSLVCGANRDQLVPRAGWEQLLRAYQ